MNVNGEPSFFLSGGSKGVFPPLPVTTHPFGVACCVTWLKRKIKKNKMKYSRSFAFILYFWIHEDVRAFSLPKITHYSSREEDPGFHLGEELQNEKGRK